MNVYTYVYVQTACMTNGVVYVRMNERIYIHMYVRRMYGRMHIHT